MTREEWLAAVKRLELLEHDFLEANPDSTVSGPTEEDAVEAILGCPCPPEPPPEPFGKDEGALVWTGTQGIHVPGQVLTADEADAMACSLLEHAAYAREQETPTRKKWKGTRGTHSRHGAIAIR